MGAKKRHKKAISGMKHAFVWSFITDGGYQGSGFKPREDIPEEIQHLIMKYLQKSNPKPTEETADAIMRIFLED